LVEHDPRAAGVLASTHEQLLRRAGSIESEADRARYLGAVPHHREITELYLSSL
jgi:hypothetical protein